MPKGYHRKNEEPRIFAAKPIKKAGNKHPIVFFVMSNGTLVIDTGGTFGSEKYEDPNNPPKNVKMLSFSMVERVLAHLNGKVIKKLEWADLKRKDSKSYTIKELEKIIIYAVDIFCADKIILVHGTDAMVKNAKAVKNILDKNSIAIKVIFCGSYIPPANGFNNSDGVNNLKTALKEIRNIKSPHGVAIAMDAVCDARAENNMERQATIYRELTRLKKEKDLSASSTNPYRMVYKK